jgi:hypothetical protein
MSGDAFTSSNLNSPEKSPIHTSPMHVDTEPETQIPPNTQIPSETTTIPQPETLETVSEIPQENLNTETVIESQLAYPLHPIAVETIPSDQIITSSQPLTMDELVIPSDQMLPLLESLTSETSRSYLSSARNLNQNYLTESLTPPSTTTLNLMLSFCVMLSILVLRTS